MYLNNAEGETSLLFSKGTFSLSETYNHTLKSHEILSDQTKSILKGARKTKA